MQRYKFFFLRKKKIVSERPQGLSYLFQKKGGLSSFSLASVILVKHAYFAVAPAQIRRACDQKHQLYPYPVGSRSLEVLKSCSQNKTPTSSLSSKPLEVSEEPPSSAFEQAMRSSNTNGRYMIKRFMVEDVKVLTCSFPGLWRV